MKFLIILIIPIITFLSCLRDTPFKNAYAGYEPVFIDDSWIIASPEDENIERSHLETAYQLLYDDDRFWMARSLLVIRNGKLIAEAYPHDISDRDHFANIQSCTKSFTSIMMGIAIQNDVDISVEDKLYDLYPDLFDTDILKREIRIKDALTMQTGLEFDNSVHTLELYQSRSNSIRFVLSFPLIHTPGDVMNYNDGAPHLVSKAIEEKTGIPMSEYASEHLFKPLQIFDWKWEHAHDGTTFGAFSLFLKPRDFAKVGQLLLQNGNWDGTQIIDSTYLRIATSDLVTANIDNKPYGYYFWINKTNQGFYAHGHGGQMLLIVPDKNLVLLYTSWPYTSGTFFDNALELFTLISEGCK